MSLGSYVLAAGGLAFVGAAFAYAAVRTRRLLLPSWQSTPARLAEIVLWASGLTIALQLLGAFGLLSVVWVLVASLVTILAASRIPLPTGPADPAPPAPRVDAPLRWISIAGAAAVASYWVTGLEYSWDHGMNHFDTLWYHAPFAARIAETGSVWSLHFTDSEFLNWFYPQGSELLHALGIEFFGRDLASPLLNLGWLAVALLAAWCIGRPYGAGPLSLLAVGAILCTNTMVPREPGNAANDIGAIALVLASGAVLVNAGAAGALSRGALIVGGLAAGLALGTKLTAAAIVAALTIGAGVIAQAGDRVRSAGVWLGAVLATGGFWFVRNLAHSGNPIPWLKDIGPIHLPSPERGLEGRDPFSLAHYLLPPDGTVIGDVVATGLLDSLGVGWPALLMLAAAGMGLALWRGENPSVRVLGAVAIVAAIAYAFTPLTASGPEGTAQGFRGNLRYAVPALALGLALLPLDRVFAKRSVALSAALVIFVPLLVSVLLTASDSDIGGDVSTSFAIVVGTVVTAIVLLLLREADRDPRRAVLASAGAVLALIVAVGVARDGYFSGRYEEGVGYGLGPAVQWAKEQSDQRIAVTGTGGAFFQYGFYGDDLSNHVQYLGNPAPNGDFQAFQSCEEWRTALNRGDYDFLIATGNLDLNRATYLRPSATFPWPQDDIDAPLVLTAGSLVAIYEIKGDLDPAGCPEPEPETGAGA